MKNRHFFLVALFWVAYLFSFQTKAQSRILESLAFKSDILKSEVKYSVYLPADYAVSKRDYPVLFLLHGYTGDNTDWTQKGDIQHIADEMIKNGELTPCVIIMPDAGNCYYLDSYDGKWDYHKMLVKEFVPAMRSEYRLRDGSRYTAVAGLSMGGFGATLFAAKNPDVFGQAVALSAAFWTDERLIGLDQKGFQRSFGPQLGNDLKGKKRVSGLWKEFSPLILFKTADKDKMNTVRWYFDCGDDDFLYIGNDRMHTLLRNRGIRHEYRMRDGAHNWAYWRSGIRLGLAFLNEGFTN
ncbi:endo-1,4-beta-xylanase [Fulvitalea axinellae]|uniref:Endo-1,4-beta-xylanase n=1 Tax=Fulvitalea axinellae TaxID=1182444 RepID=A0AAU9D1H0_9BACT|nr:endo-1,4-beta-xylanase [Fulvitalea axinellae]